MERASKISIVPVAAAMLIALAAQLWFARERTVVVIDYSDFKTLVRAGHVQALRVSDTWIAGAATSQMRTRSCQVQYAKRRSAMKAVWSRSGPRGSKIRISSRSWIVRRCAIRALPIRTG
jgi:hypothetical protein